MLKASLLMVLILAVGGWFLSGAEPSHACTCGGWSENDLPDYEKIFVGEIEGVDRKRILRIQRAKTWFYGYIAKSIWGHIARADYEYVDWTARWTVLHAFKGVKDKTVYGRWRTKVPRKVPQVGPRASSEDIPDIACSGELKLSENPIWAELGLGSYLVFMNGDEQQTSPCAPTNHLIYAGEQLAIVERHFGRYQR